MFNSLQGSQQSCKTGKSGKSPGKIGLWVLAPESGNILLAHWGFQYLTCSSWQSFSKDDSKNLHFLVIIISFLTQFYWLALHQLTWMINLKGTLVLVVGYILGCYFYEYVILVFFVVYIRMSFLLWVAYLCVFTTVVGVFLDLQQRSVPF